MNQSNRAVMTLPSDREILVTRVFDAPRALVFRAHTDPALIPLWWGPRYLTTVVAQLDVRPGGAWRFVQRSPDGSEYGFRGEFREIRHGRNTSSLSPMFRMNNRRAHAPFAEFCAAHSVNRFSLSVLRAPYAAACSFRNLGTPIAHFRRLKQIDPRLS